MDDDVSDIYRLAKKVLRIFAGKKKDSFPAKNLLHKQLNIRISKTEKNYPSANHKCIDFIKVHKAKMKSNEKKKSTNSYLIERWQKKVSTWLTFSFH